MTRQRWRRSASAILSSSPSYPRRSAPWGTSLAPTRPWSSREVLVALEAVLLSTCILMSQRRQDQLADRRTHLDLQINLLSEQENSKMLAMLAALMRHQGLALDDPEVAALQEATRPEVLVQQLEQ